MKKNRKIAWILSIAMVLSICLAACGGGSGSGGSSSAPSADQRGA